MSRLGGERDGMREMHRVGEEERWIYRNMKMKN